MKGKLIILIGISGSGKSTFAKEFVRDNKNSVVVSRDKARGLLFGYTEETIKEYYTLNDYHKKEKLVSYFLENNITRFLNKGMTVVVDNTHLKVKYLQEYEKYDCEKQIKLFEADLSIALLRDKSRVRQVGAEIIKAQCVLYNELLNHLKMDCNYNIYYPFKNEDKRVEQKTHLRKAIICDIDGTLAKMNGRSPFEWGRVGEDEVQEHIRMIVNMYKRNGYVVFIFTGRDGVCREITEKWLEEKNVHYDFLHCRKEKDTRSDSIVKEEMFREHVLDKYYVEVVLDDRVSVLKKWCELGLTVLSNNPLGVEF